MDLGEDQVPWFDDLYLDLVVSPNDEFEILGACPSNPSSFF